MTLKRRTPTVYQGSQTPPLTANPKVPTPFWIDTSDPVGGPVLKIHNADNTAWIAVGAAPEAPVDPYAGILSAGATRTQLSSPTVDDSDIQVVAKRGLLGKIVASLSMSLSSVILEVLTGADFDVPGGKLALGASSANLSSPQFANFTAGSTGAAGILNLAAIDAGGGVAGKVALGADGVDLMHGTEVQAEVTADGFKLNVTDPTGMFHVGAMPASGVAGQTVVDVNDGFKMKTCTVSGTPGTWELVGAQSA